MPGDSEKYDSLPIPTYEEATSSRPSSSASYRATIENDEQEDAERQGLLSSRQAGRFGGATNNSAARRGNDDRGNYRAPTVESERSSYDSAFTSPEVTDDEDAAADAELRRDLEEMEVSDPEAERRAQQRARMRRRFQKRIASVTSTFSNLHLPRLPDLTFFSSLRSRLPAIPDRYSISWPVIARLVALFIIASVVYVLIVIKVMPSRGMVGSTQFNPDSVRDFLIRNVEGSSIESHLRELSFDDHVAGTAGDWFYANWIEDHFDQYKVDSVYSEDFQVYMNYPKDGKQGRRVAIVDPPELRWEAALDEDPVPHAPINSIMNPSQTASLQRHQYPAFQPHAASGDVEGPLVYANYGDRHDFEKLHDLGFNLEGSVCLMRHWGSQPSVALKVKAAQDAGCVGALIYSDPAEDGPPSPEAPHAPADDPWRRPDSVHRSPVSLFNRILGDPLTPGWTSTQDADRLDVSSNPALPRIPSLPLAWRDAKPLLEAITNVGAPAPPNFSGAVPNVAYWTGNSSSSATPKVQIQFQADVREQKAIRNVVAQLRGLEEPEAHIYVGAPRDALCFGATQPGSGSAILMELVRIFGKLAQNGWRPRRSIVFASWDGGQYNAAGSTEHVEARQKDLRLHGVSYLNLDAGVYGNSFKARGSPVFKSLLHSTLSRVVDPTTNTSLLETWNASRIDLESLPTSLGDYLAFHDIAGVSSIDLSFVSNLDADRAPPAGDTASKSQQTPASYPKGSCQDTLAWLTTHGDPSFAYHILLTQVVALLLFELADAPILPLDLAHYSTSIASSIDSLIDELHINTVNPSEEVDHRFNLPMLLDAGKTLTRKIKKFETWTASYLASMGASIQPAEDTGPHFGMSTPQGEPREFAAERIVHNQRIAGFESHLLDLPLPPGTVITDDDDAAAVNPNLPAQPDAPQPPSPPDVPRPPRAPRAAPSSASERGNDDDQYGLPHARQYKHVLHGPRKWASGSNKPFPGIRDAFEEGDWDGVLQQVEVAANAVRWAAWRLDH